MTGHRPNASRSGKQKWVYEALQLAVTSSYFDASYYMAADIEAVIGSFPVNRSTNLTGEALNITPQASYALNQTVHEWRSPVASEPWFVQLQVGEHDGGRLRLCWHVRLPAMVRLTCHLFAEHEGGALGWDGGSDVSRPQVYEEARNYCLKRWKHILVLQDDTGPLTTDLHFKRVSTKAAGAR